MIPIKSNIQYMLQESNAIEDVFDQASLRCARKAWDYMFMFETMNTQIIKHAHKVLMKNQEIDARHKGAWREVPVWIGGVRKDDSPEEIDLKMKAWCQKTMDPDRSKPGIDPISLHVEFEEIHPFVDGNGRLGRMIMNWHLVKRNKSNLMVYTRDRRHVYYQLFNSYQSAKYDSMVDQLLTGDWTYDGDDSFAGK
jgi:Fic family protein